jgi:hypothetical protein
MSRSEYVVHPAVEQFSSQYAPTGAYLKPVKLSSSQTQDRKHNNNINTDSETAPALHRATSVEEVRTIVNSSTGNIDSMERFRKLFTSSWRFNSQWAFFRAMFEADPDDVMQRESPLKVEAVGAFSLQGACMCAHELLQWPEKQILSVCKALRYAEKSSELSSLLPVRPRATVQLGPCEYEIERVTAAAITGSDIENSDCVLYIRKTRRYLLAFRCHFRQMDSIEPLVDHVCKRFEMDGM